MGRHDARDLSPVRSSGPRKSSRIAAIRVYDTIDPAECWEDFDAEEHASGDPADGSEACSAGIYDTSGDGHRYSGATKNQNGHAEIDSLIQLLQEVGAKNLKTRLDEGIIEVSCPDKPCRAHCSIFLGILGVKARNYTKNTKSTMIISYWAPRTLKEFVREEFNYSDESIKDGMQAGCVKDGAEAAICLKTV